MVTLFSKCSSSASSVLHPHESSTKSGPQPLFKINTLNGYERRRTQFPFEQLLTSSSRTHRCVIMAEKLVSVCNFPWKISAKMFFSAIQNHLLKVTQECLKLKGFFQLLPFSFLWESLAKVTHLHIFTTSQKICLLKKSGQSFYFYPYRCGCFFYMEKWPGCSDVREFWILVSSHHSS